jgi:acyl-CoA dehydrogenase
MFITGAEGASVGIVMARTGEGEHAKATMFLVDLPHPAVRIERVLDTIDSSMPGGHAQVLIDDLVLGDEHVLGEADEGFRYAQVRLSPARLSHCMRWLGSATRAHEIAVAYATTRKSFGKLLIDQASASCWPTT